MPGYVGQSQADNSPDANKTTIYASPEYGVAAWAHMLRVRYFNGDHRPRTLLEIIRKYAGGNSIEDYINGYHRFSNGELNADTLIDLYNSQQMAVLAIAAYSHELSFWYPLSDAQMQRAFQLADETTRRWESRGFFARLRATIRGLFQMDKDGIAPNEERMFEEKAPVPGQPKALRAPAQTEVTAMNVIRAAAKTQRSEPLIEIDGFVLQVERLREEYIPGDPDTGSNIRTAGNYTALFNGRPIDGLSGMVFERLGPGDNGPNGKQYARRVEQGTYPLITQGFEGSHYKTWGYVTNDEHPRPGVLLGETNVRSGCLFHPGGGAVGQPGYLRSIGCLNLSKPLHGVAKMDPFDGRDRVIAVIEAMKSKLGSQFPATNGHRIPNAWIEIKGEPPHPDSLSDTMLSELASARSVDARVFAEAALADRYAVLAAAMNGQVLVERISADFLRRLAAHAGDLRMTRGEFGRTLWSEWMVGWQSTCQLPQAQTRARLQDELKQIAQLLLEAGVDINDGVGLHTPAVEAALGGFTETLLQLAAMGADLNLPDASGTTPLAAAAFHGELGAVDFLLGRGVDPQMRTRSPQSTAGAAMSEVYSEVCPAGATALDCARVGLAAHGITSARQHAQYRHIVAILQGTGSPAPGLAPPPDSLIDPAAPAVSEREPRSDYEAAKRRANYGDANPADHASPVRRRASPGTPPPVIAIDIAKAKSFLTACMTSTPRVTYKLGAKIHHPPEHPVPGKDFIQVDCSGFVREVIREATDPPMKQFPDGSVVQHDWISSQGFRQSSFEAGKSLDDKVRIAFLEPQDSGEHIGHVLLIHNGRTLESHGHDASLVHGGPDSRAWNGQHLQEKMHVFELT
jgi:hypothetical protein